MILFKQEASVSLCIYRSISIFRIRNAYLSSSTTRSAAYRYETVRINKSPYLVGGIDVDAVRALNGHWEIEGRWPGDGEVLIGLDVAEATGFKVGSTPWISF